MSVAATAIPLLPHRAALGLLGALVAAALAPQPAQANMMQQIIVGKCSEAMQADFKKSGKTPPAGMVDSTCSCVVAQMKKRQSIDQAKTTCTKQALQQYGQI